MQVLEIIASILSEFNRIIGKVVSWCCLLLVLLVFTIAVLRYVFIIGSVSMQELVIYLHAIIFMVGISYTLADEGHVRVDVLYSRFTEATKAWINLWGTLLFLFPVCTFIVYASLGYVHLSWAINESSPEAGGLPNLYLLKSLILVFPVLLMIQGLAILLNSMVTILRSKGIND